MLEWNPSEPEQPMLDTGYLARLTGHVGTTVLAELMADGLIERKRPVSGLWFGSALADCAQV